MPLNESALKASIKAALLHNLPSPSGEQTDQADTLAGSLATAIRTFVEGATVNYSSGLTASTYPVTEIVPGITGFTLS